MRTPPHPKNTRKIKKGTADLLLGDQSRKAGVMACRINEIPCLFGRLSTPTAAITRLWLGIVCRARYEDEKNRKQNHPFHQVVVWCSQAGHRFLFFVFFLCCWFLPLVVSSTSVFLLCFSLDRIECVCGVAVSRPLDGGARRPTVSHRIDVDAILDVRRIFRSSLALAAHYEKVPWPDQ